MICLLGMFVSRGLLYITLLFKVGLLTYQKLSSEVKKVLVPEKGSSREEGRKCFI